MGTITPAPTGAAAGTTPVNPSEHTGGLPPTIIAEGLGYTAILGGVPAAAALKGTSTVARLGVGTAAGLATAGGVAASVGLYDLVDHTLKDHGVDDHVADLAAGGSLLVAGTGLWAGGRAIAGRGTSTASVLGRNVADMGTAPMIVGGAGLATWSAEQLAVSALGGSDVARLGVGAAVTTAAGLALKATGGLKVGAAPGRAALGIGLMGAGLAGALEAGSTMPRLTSATNGIPSPLRTGVGALALGGAAFSGFKALRSFLAGGRHTGMWGAAALGATLLGVTMLSSGSHPVTAPLPVADART